MASKLGEPDYWLRVFLRPLEPDTGSAGVGKRRCQMTREFIYLWPAEPLSNVESGFFILRIETTCYRESIIWRIYQYDN